MNILQQIDLKNYSSINLGGKASYACKISTRYDVPTALEWAKKQGVGVRMIGAGTSRLTVPFTHRS